MNAAVVFFVIGMGVAVVLLATRLASRGQRQNARDSDGGSSYPFGGHSSGDGHRGDHGDAGGMDSGSGDGGSGGGGDGGGGGGGDGGGGGGD